MSRKLFLPHELVIAEPASSAVAPTAAEVSASATASASEATASASPLTTTASVAVSAPASRRIPGASSPQRLSRFQVHSAAHAELQLCQIGLLEPNAGMRFWQAVNPPRCWDDFAKLAEHAELLGYTATQDLANELATLAWLPFTQDNYRPDDLILLPELSEES